MRTDGQAKSLMHSLTRYIAPSRGWRIWHNFPQKLGALATAIALWAVVAGDQQVVIERTFEVRLRLTGTNRSQVVTDLPQTVRITLSGQRSRLETLDPALVEATVNVAQLPIGPFDNLSVKVTPPAETQVARVNPSEVSGYLDQVVRSLRDVRIGIVNLESGQPPDITVRPTSVLIEGPRTKLEQVIYVLALTPSTLSTNLEASTTLTPIDNRGQPVSGVTLQPNTVTLSREEIPMLEERFMPLELVGIPANLSASEVKLQPTEVRVRAAPEVLKALKHINARPLGSLVAGRITASLQIILPTGVQLTEAVEASVSMKLEARKRP